MAERTTELPLALLDVAVGTAVAALRATARPRAVLSGLAGSATGVARAVAGGLPGGLADRLRAGGQEQRAAARTALEMRLRAAVPRLVEAVLDRLDLTELVLRRVDLDRVAQGLDVELVLDRLDLTELVLRRVDLDRVARALDVDAVALRIDLDAIAARLDLIGLAEQVVDGIDLPQIIRDSTGSVASEGVAGIRVQSMEADQAVAHFVDRVLRRRPRHPPAQAGENGHRPAADISLLNGSQP